MSTPRVTVLAGSKAFTNALAGPVAERVGERPRVAADPGQAFALCRSGSAVLVLEYEPAWAGVLKDLARSATGLRVIAALPPAAMEAEPALRALGVRTVRWEGDAAPLLDAIRPAGPALTPAPRPAGPALTPAPRPAVTPAPRSGGPALTPAPRPAGPALTPAPRPAHTPPPGGQGTFFSDLGADRGPDAPAVPEPAAAALWPSTAPGEEESEQLLLSALAGLAAAGDAALGATIEALTPLETEALQSLASVADPAPLRRLAALRYRVAFALSTAPAPGSPVDAGGGNLLLTEIDEALPALKDVAERLPARASEIDAIRNALVKEAVDLSEMLHRIQPGAPIAPVPAAAPDPRRTTGRMRVDVTQAPPPAARKRTGMWVTFAVVVALGAAFHTRQYWLRRAGGEQAGFPGAPAGLVGAQPSGETLSVLLPGEKAPSKAELERFRNEQAAKGNEVAELPSGGLLVLPGRAGTAAPAPTPEAR